MRSNSTLELRIGFAGAVMLLVMVMMAQSRYHS